MEDSLGWIGWLVLGGIAGWIASAVVTAPRSGCIFNIVLGILGAFVGGLLYNFLTDDEWSFDFNIPSLVVAVLGSIVLLAIINIATRGTRKRRP